MTLPQPGAQSAQSPVRQSTFAHRRLLLLGGLVLTGAVSMAARQAPPQQPQTAEIEKLRDNLYVIKGGGGNTAAFITQGGVVVVDTKLDNWGGRILEKIRTVTDKPVTMIINTHTHGDHTGSNHEFPGTVDIVAQENTRVNMAKMPAFAEDNARFLPKRTFKDKMTLLTGADRIDLYYFGPGHTNGDAFVVFPALRVMHSGDIFSGKTLPIMDVANGGAGLAYPRTLEKAAKKIHGVDTVIPGHDVVMPWSAFVEYGRFLKWEIDSVRKSAKAGQTAEAAAAALTPPEKFKGYNMQRAAANVKVIYDELKKK